jgi:hypothetical protein
MLADATEGLADEAGTACGEIRRDLREELRKEVETLRGEMTLLRAQMNARPQKARDRSRAPFELDDDDVTHRN